MDPGKTTLRESFTDKSPLADQLYDLAWIGDIAEMQKILRTGHSPNIKSKGETVLGKAAWEQHTEAVRLLLDYKADPNLQNNNSLHTALHKAAARNNLPIVLMLLRAQADVSLKNKYGHTALHEAAYAGGLDIVKALVKAGASVFDKSAANMTPREMALKNNQLLVAAYLQRAEKRLARCQPHKTRTNP